MGFSRASKLSGVVLIVSTAEDEAVAAHATFKNALQSYSYNLRNSLSDEKFAGKFEATDKTKLETTGNENIACLDASQKGSKEEYKENQKELEAIANSIGQKLYCSESTGGAYSPAARPAAVPLATSPALSRTAPASRRSTNRPAS